MSASNRRKSEISGVFKCVRCEYREKADLKPSCEILAADSAVLVHGDCGLKLRTDKVQHVYPLKQLRGRFPRDNSSCPI